jgi:hypothetical protein
LSTTGLLVQDERGCSGFAVSDEHDRKPSTEMNLGQEGRSGISPEVKTWLSTSAPASASAALAAGAAWSTTVVGSSNNVASAAEITPGAGAVESVPTLGSHTALGDEERQSSAGLLKVTGLGNLTTAVLGGGNALGASRQPPHRQLPDKADSTAAAHLKQTTQLIRELQNSLSLDRQALNMVSQDPSVVLKQQPRGDDPAAAITTILSSLMGAVGGNGALMPQENSHDEDPAASSGNKTIMKSVPMSKLCSSLNGRSHYSLDDMEVEANGNLVSGGDANENKTLNSGVGGSRKASARKLKMELLHEDDVSYFRASM